MQNPSHSYSQAGDYTVILEVTDEDGAMGSCRQTISVTLAQNTLSTFAIPSDGGNVTLSPAGGTNEKGTEVTVTAEPASGYRFDHWSGDLSGTSKTKTVTINSDMEIIAHFIETGEEKQSSEKLPEEDSQRETGTEYPLTWIGLGVIIALITGIGIGKKT
ncbi:hypothetical protein AKJ61_01225 [candidate division MSBL1 archaeon SCGC-AAA259B11]|uniref:PKD domain-containing protein n=1 Tax=candidate division MSBL1 archaeon SCGC-AAA259B11 TaxID=1698260 RepID=A0A133U7L6_9EURY|nr:hypothetical protein AKJ61_01225 [candidate division MSBL1 archaeon SCGC-AAA259B11]